MLIALVLEAHVQEGPSALIDEGRLCPKGGRLTTNEYGIIVLYKMALALYSGACYNARVEFSTVKPVLNGHTRATS